MRYPLTEKNFFDVQEPSLVGIPSLVGRSINFGFFEKHPMVGFNFSCLRRSELFLASHSACCSRKSSHTGTSHL